MSSLQSTTASFRTLSNMIELLSKEVTTFSSNIDVWHGSEFASDHDALPFSNHTSISKYVFLEH